MEVEKLTEVIQREKKCSQEEALQIIDLLEFNKIVHQTDAELLKKKALELWDAQFGQSSRNFGLSMHEFTALVDRLKNGDQSLFERVFLHHFNDCMLYLIHQKSTLQHIAYDATMDTLLKFRQLLVDGKITYGNLRYLFTRMAVFAAQKIRMKNTRIDPIESMQEMTVQEPDTVEEESLTILAKAWKKLGEECQHLLTHFYYNSKSWKEIAVLMEISEDNARKKGQRCRDALTTIVKDYT
jgi:DNA-directed RNA polymerase specialized sigma24 family protein